MKSSFLPFLLAISALFLISINSTMPLLEWRISSIVSDFPESYRYKYGSTFKWEMKASESLDNKALIFSKIRISDGEKLCINTTDFKLTVLRSSQEEFIEMAFQRIAEPISKLAFILIILAGIYHLWVKIWIDKSPAFKIILLAFFSLLLVLIPLAALMIIGPIASPFVYPSTAFNFSRTCHGALTFEATLQKVHMDALATLLGGILAEAVAFVIMFKRLMDTIKNKPRLVESQG